MPSYDSWAAVSISKDLNLGWGSACVFTDSPSDPAAQCRWPIIFGLPVDFFPNNPSGSFKKFKMSVLLPPSSEVMACCKTPCLCSSTKPDFCMEFDFLRVFDQLMNGPFEFKRQFSVNYLLYFCLLLLLFFLHFGALRTTWIWSTSAKMRTPLIAPLVLTFSSCMYTGGSQTDHSTQLKDINISLHFIEPTHHSPTLIISKFYCGKTALKRYAKNKQNTHTHTSSCLHKCSGLIHFAKYNKYESNLFLVLMLHNVGRSKPF